MDPRFRNCWRIFLQTPTQLIVALDIGTSSTRALLYDTAGRMQPGREVKAEYAQRLTADGGVECDPDRLLALTLGALKKLLRLISKSERERIVAVGASCFWHALMGIDANGDAVTPLYSWADTRAHVAVPALADLLDPRSYHQSSGAFIHPCYWPAKIEWLKRDRPDLASKVAQWISFPDYMTLRLAGECKTSVSIASATGLMNRQLPAWDDKVLRSLALHTRELPDIAADDATFIAAGALAPSALRGIPWHFANGDGACSNIGAGGTSDSRLVINVSTSGAARFICETAQEQLPDGLFDYRLDRSRHVIGGAISNGGNVFAWLRHALTLPLEPGLERALRAASPAAHGLVVLPFWAGERSPGWHANARASILGLGLSTQPLEIAQASMESVAYSIRQIRDLIAGKYPQASDVIVSGGAVESSRYMQQLLADVLNTPVRVSLDAEPSGRGAALSVAERIGALKSIRHAKDELSHPIVPRIAAVKAHEIAFERYARFYAELVR